MTHMDGTKHHFFILVVETIQEHKYITTFHLRNKIFIVLVIFFNVCAPQIDTLVIVLLNLHFRVKESLHLQDKQNIGYCIKTKL